MTPADGSAHPAPFAERGLVVSRMFAASPEALFRAWTDPVALARWWGPAGFTNPVCEMDARPGGAVRIVMRAPDGTDHSLLGRVRELEPGRRLVFEWNAVDGAGQTLLLGLTTVTFRARDGGTEMTVANTGTAMVAMAVAMLDGMEPGWTQSLERLAAIADGQAAERAEPVTKLYYFEVLAPRKVCALARHLGAPVQFVRLDPRRGEHRTAAMRALNPNAKVPVLVDGDTVLWESGAIMCHLARRAGSPLWPDDSRQADVLRWMLWEVAHFARPAGGLYFEHVVKAMFRIGDPDPAEVAASTDGFRQQAGVLEAHLATRDYLVGDALTIADFAVGNVLAYAEAARIPLAEFPAVARWYARLDALPAWRDAYPAVADALA